MHGYLNQDVSLAYIAQRQAAFENAARRRRLIRTLKDARRAGLDQNPPRPDVPSRCGTDLG